MYIYIYIYIYNRFAIELMIKSFCARHQDIKARKHNINRYINLIIYYSLLYLFVTSDRFRRLIAWLSTLMMLHCCSQKRQTFRYKTSSVA